jgi:DNA topoisomerase-1
LAKTDDPSSIDAERAIQIIDEKRKKESERLIKQFPEDETIQVLNGRYGPYIAQGKNNYRIPKSTDPKSLTFEQVKAIIGTSGDAPKKTTKAKASPVKKTKTTTTKKAKK